MEFKLVSKSEYKCIEGTPVNDSFAELVSPALFYEDEMMMRGAWQSLSADGVLRVNEKDLNLIWSYTRTVEMPNATDGTTEEIEMTKTGFLLLCRLCGTDTAAPSRHVALEYVLSDLPARA